MVDIHVRRALPPAQSALPILSRIARELIGSKPTSAEAKTSSFLQVPPMIPTSPEQPQVTPPQQGVGNDATAPCLVPVRYQDQQYPSTIPVAMTEVSATFDSQVHSLHGPYSLHTEFAGKRIKFSSPHLEGLDALLNSHHKGVAELWTSVAWAEQFAQFIRRAVGTSEAPTVIEVHPPFMAKDQTLDTFLDRYTVFERIILAAYPNCRIVMENRKGSKLSRKFLISDLESLLALGQALEGRNLRLGIALDLPALFTAELGGRHMVGMEGVELVRRLAPIAGRIETLHLWGRGPGGGAHFGDLDGVFAPETDAKRACLQALHELLLNGSKRFLVVEVSKHFGWIDSILWDLEQAGFRFSQM